MSDNEPGNTPIVDVPRRQHRDECFAFHSDRAAGCPGCGVDCRAVAIVKLVYTFEVCTCGEEDYDHLYEQFWHRVCFLRDR